MKHTKKFIALMIAALILTVSTFASDRGNADKQALKASADYKSAVVKLAACYQTAIVQADCEAQKAHYKTALALEFNTVADGKKGKATQERVAGAQENSEQAYGLLEGCLKGKRNKSFIQQFGGLVKDVGEGIGKVVKVTVNLTLKIP